MDNTFITPITPVFASTGSDYYNIYRLMDRVNLRQRAQNLEDKYGVPLQDIEDYRKTHGGFGGLKAIFFGVLTAAAAVGVGLLIAHGAALALPIAAGVGLFTGALAFGVTMAVQDRKVSMGYRSYLSAESARLHATQGQSEAPELQNDVPARKGPFTADVAASRESPAGINAPAR